MSQDQKIITIVGVITAVLVSGAMFFLNKPTSPVNTPPSSPPVDNKTLLRDDSYKIASDSAKVTLVEFADFQCPACAVVYPNVKQILSDYNGRINYVFRHFPLPQHKNAPKAAEAAEAAGAQGKFWSMYDKLFQTQNDWSNLNDPTDKFVGYASELGLDTAKFKQEVDSNKYQAKIQRDQTDGEVLNVNATPTFYINGVQMTSEPSIANFHTAIDAQLNK